MIIVGLGLGVSFPVFTLTVQNSVEQNLLGVATASTQLFRQIGGTIAVSIMGTIMTQRMIDRLNETTTNAHLGDAGSLSPEIAEKLSVLQDPEVLMDADKLSKLKASLPVEIHEMFTKMLDLLREALSYSLSGVFLLGAIVILVACVITLFLKEIPLRTSQRQKEEVNLSKLSKQENN